MSIWLKAAGKWGSVLAIVALILTFLKTIIGFIAFLTGAIKLLIVLVFIALIAGILIRLTSPKNAKQDWHCQNPPIFALPFSA